MEQTSAVERGGERLIVVPEVVAFGGAERSVLALAHWLHARAIPHRVLMYWDAIGLARHASFPLTSTTLNPPRSAPRKIAALRHYLRRKTAQGPPPLMSGYQAALHASIGGLRGFHTLMHDTPSLFSDYDQPKPFVAKIRRRLETVALRRGLQSGGTTIVTSEFLQNDVRGLYGCPAQIARMGGVAGHTRFRLRPVDKVLNILSVSRLEFNKRLDWIIRALGALELHIHSLSSTVDWTFDIVGEGAQRADLKSLSGACGIASRVRFHGFVDDRALADHFDRAHLFVMPSRQGYGIPAVEALSRGIPVLLHRESGVSDILRTTPWCVVAEGAAEEFPAFMRRSIQSVMRHAHHSAPLPQIPTEAEWAETVAVTCGWV